MKKSLIAVVCAAVVALCVSIFSPAMSKSTTVSAVQANKADAGVYEARFLNMLNHNFVYGEDFCNADTVVNNSVLALLDLRDEENPDYIDELYVKGFVKDMYGIDIVDMEPLNSQYPTLEGFLYIIPRGFTSYKHTIDSVLVNEDGSFTVITNVLVNGHDADVNKIKAVSLFVENKESSFGYNIISCDLIENSSDI